MASLPSPLIDRTYRELVHFPLPSNPRLEDVPTEEGKQAVRLAHRDEIARVRQALQHHQSVLIKADKELTRPFLAALREALGSAVQFVEGAVGAGQGTVGTGPLLVQAMVSKLGDVATGVTRASGILVLPHLDLMTCTGADQPGSHLNDVVYWLSERNDVTVLAFWGIDRPVPPVLRQRFPEVIELGSFPRYALWQLLSGKEARRLCNDAFGETFTLRNQLKIYHHVSGLNVIRLRQALRELGSSDVADPYQFLKARSCPGAVLPADDWGDVVGYQTVRDDLDRNVLFPMKLRELATTTEELALADSMINQGVVLHGPPGTGKTEFAKFLARELKASLQVIRGPELKNMYVGETERAIREIFVRARREAPSVILVEEIDALIPRRDTHSSYHEVGVSGQWLTEMSQLQREAAVFVVATTNRAKELDKAFFRPGRFGPPVLIDYPSAEDRRAILRHHAKKRNLTLSDKAIETLVTLTEGPLDPTGDREEARWLDAYKNHLGNPAFYQAAGPLADKRLREELGLPFPERFSGDHLRGICQNHLIEIHYGEKTGKRIDPNDDVLLQKAVDSVRPRRTPAPPDKPEEPPFDEGFS